MSIKQIYPLKLFLLGKEFDGNDWLNNPATMGHLFDNFRNINKILDYLNRDQPQRASCNLTQGEGK